MKTVGNIIICYAMQIGFTIGLIVIFGFLIALCNRMFYKNFGSYGLKVCYITGAIGTPIHECSHALFCLIFGHKINEIKLFQINSDDGTLGYVNHSYNPKNIYQKIGNFFIGVAPIIIISAILYLIAYFLMPGFISNIYDSFDVNDFFGNFGGVFKGLLNVLSSFFKCALSWQWWVFLIFGIFLSLHMTLSPADIKGALSGIILLLVAVLIADVIIGLISAKILNTVTQAILSVSGYLLCILVLSLIISVLAVLISLIFRLIRRK